MRTFIVAGLIFASLAVPASVPDPSTEADSLAIALLESLSPTLRSQANPAFADPYRHTWNFVPLARQGVHLGEMSAEQSAHATKLLKSSLSDAGYKKVEQIRMLEDVLFEREGRNPGRDKQNYVFVIFGTPSANGAWGWRYEGHHLSLNFTYQNDVLISSSPQFLGTNPADVTEGPHKGRPLAKEQDLAFAFLDSLNDDQRTRAILSTKDPGEIITTNQRKVAILERKGVPWADLNARQRQALLALVKVHAEVQATSEQARRLKLVEPQSLIFAWMGSDKPGRAHYYRIQGAKFLIEYDNSQNNANHIHSVWRDFDGDFGEDVLGAHYWTSPHSHPH